MTRDRVRTLVLYGRFRVQHSYYDDWKDAFLSDPRFSADAVDICARGAAARAERSIGECDLVVLLHSTNADAPALARLARFEGALGRRRGKLLAFVGNELNLPSVSMEEKIGLLRRAGAEFIGTQLPIEAGRWLYAECAGARVVPLPHALNPDAFRPRTPHAARPIDIGARSFAYLPFLGDNDRNDLLSFFAARRFDPPLAVDIDTRERLPREAWAAFLDSCRGTVATEAGSFWLERDDRTVREIEAYLLERERRRGGVVLGRGTALDRAGAVLPPSARRAAKEVLGRIGIRHANTVGAAAPFEEIFDRFFRGRARPPVYAKAISSRHFDAIGAKTCQIMFPGRFNGILRAGEHYIALARDFSNVDEALRLFRDEGARTSLVDRTYAYVREEHTYGRRLSDVVRLLEGA